jgi:CRP/FNR family transcriptional regulator, cyclic AMP receptor protein
MTCAASLSTSTERPTAFYAQLNHVERSALRKTARLRKYAAGTHLALQGDRSDQVFIVVSGWIKVTVAVEGGEVVLAVRGPGDIVGESPAVGGEARSATVTSLGEVSTMMVPADPFIAFLDEHPRTWRLLSSTLTHRLEETERRLRLQGTASADGSQRLASLLVGLADGYGSPGPDGSVVIPVPLSQQDLASWGGASRKTMVRALRVWRQRGMIDTTYRKITILDLPGLRRLAGDPVAGR